MPEPIVFISHFRVRPGRLDDVRQMTRGAAERLMLDKPGTSAFLIYLDEPAMQLTIVHVFPDAESMDLHFEGSDQRSQAAHELFEPAGWEIYGKPSDAALATMRSDAAVAGVTLAVAAELVAGFLRV
jgi:hypothetical protein